MHDGLEHAVVVVPGRADDAKRVEDEAVSHGNERGAEPEHKVYAQIESQVHVGRPAVLGVLRPRLEPNAREDLERLLQRNRQNVGRNLYARVMWLSK